MVLYLSAVNRQGQCRDFSCQFDQLERAFDLLSVIAGRGDKLTKAYLLENDKRTDLPLDAFDGEPFIDNIQALEKEWQSVLNIPQAPAVVAQDELIDWTQQQLDGYESRISTHQRMIDLYECWLLRTRRTFTRGPIRTAVISRYESSIHRHQMQLSKVQSSYEAAYAKLNRLLP